MVIEFIEPDRKKSEGGGEDFEINGAISTRNIIQSQQTTKPVKIIKNIKT